MADGFTRPAPVRHADGVYLDLPLDAYLADDALSGSAFKTLLSGCPADLTWDSPANPLYLKPDAAMNRPRLRGAAAHCAILEGLSAYEQRYAVKPEGVLASVTDLKAWLGAERQRRIADSIDGKLARDDAQAVKQTGERADLIARIHAIDPRVQIWDPDDDVAVLHETDDRYVRLCERYVRANPAMAPHVDLARGLPEVSIFWTEASGMRFKARPDFLTPETLLDLKTFARAPGRGRSLREHCIMTAGFNGYDLQAAHNWRAVCEAAGRRCGETEFPIVAHFGRDADLCAALFSAYAQQPPTFRWLFLRMNGAPDGMTIPFRESAQWRAAFTQIDDAIEIARGFQRRFKPGELWLATHAEEEIEDMDWPFAASAGHFDDIEGVSS